MAKITMEEAEEFTLLPEEAVVRVRLMETKVREYPTKDGKDTWEKLACTFKITDVYDRQLEGFIGDTVYGGVSFRFTDHPDNKLRQWTEALLDMELSVGFELDTDDLVGREAKGVVGHYTNKGSEYHEIVSLLPLGDGGPAPQVPVQDNVDQQVRETVGAGVGSDDDIPF